MKKVLFLSAIALLYTLIFVQDSFAIQVIWKLEPKNYIRGIEYLRKNEYDIAGINSRTGTIDVVSERDVDARSDLLEEFAILEEVWINAPTGDSEKYLNSEKVAERLKALRKRYPALTQFYTLGKSLEGRDILALKISTDAAKQDANKPAVLFDAMHHAREVMTPEVPLDIAETLLANANDVHVKQWLDNLQIWVVPMLNVDGNNRVWTEDRMWRKNVRDGYGVDINRNYPYRWGQCNGSSGNHNKQDYRGEYEGSEPETQAMVNLMNTIRPTINLSFHSYGEWLIYPFGCNGERGSAEVVNVGNQLASLLPADDGEGHYTPGTAWELLYDVDGDSVDYAYATFGTLAFTAEMNQNFFPDYDENRDQTVAKFRPAWAYLLDKALEKR